MATLLNLLKKFAGAQRKSGQNRLSTPAPSGPETRQRSARQLALNAVMRARRKSGARRTTLLLRAAGRPLQRESTRARAAPALPLAGFLSTPEPCCDLPRPKHIRQPYFLRRVPGTVPRLAQSHG